ncbi:PEP-CTERM sorting domain-containing protein [Bythopirellula polymerisocia]|uniref:Ice-binding protein C-terminal domain-containing protein n=1 Tax=Bythopirellula polymerisocia TaxID=2528003 RepID=A0A5C6CJC9_9BACT|nr:PEP-CTERM sorting domain-containing protein [Bythopirellula polymerisocia]TWU24558.1 hypothetical protein Pla144_34420 [Bythopirellula polymerisocia]
MKTTRTILAVTVAILLTLVPASLQAAVVLSDGFGDADRNNDNVIDGSDTDTGTDGIGTYIPARSSNTAMATNNEVATALDSNDKGLRWLSNSGFTGSNTGDRRAFIAIVDDANLAMVETQPTSVAGGLGTTAINDGYALSYNSKGRGNSMTAIFGQTVSLGPEVGDQVKVSFDFRVWADAPNANAVQQPDDAQLRFGLFQDTDSQLGQINPVAGPDVDGAMTSARWGFDDGYFDGTRGSIAVTGSDIGSTNDRGWYGQVVVENPNGSFPPPFGRQNGGDWRIREETNVPGADPNDKRIMQGTGDDDTVAVPQPMTPGGNDFGLINLVVGNVYNLSLTLERFTDVNPGDTIKASLTTTDRASGLSYTLSDYENVMVDDGMGGMIPDGISSDSWDYFALRNTGLDDMDLLVDNFLLEIFGSNEPSDNADFDGDGDVDGRDFLVWQRGGSPNGINSGDLALWKSQYGTTPLAAAIGAVPEPSSLLLLSLSGVLSLAVRRRSRS